jgi:hypothetical protein
MGYAVLLTGGPPQRAIDLFREGVKYDKDNVDVYLGLDRAMEKAGMPVSDRVQALQSFPQMPSAPAVFVFRLIQLLGEAGEFDQAENLMANRFFPREEGGANMREVYIALKLKQAKLAASRNQCAPAREILQHLADPVASLSFTAKGLEPFAASASSQQAMAEIRSVCR